MRLRHLAMALSKLPPHPQHDVTLEQYATEGDFAARWIAEIVQRGDLGEGTRCWKGYEKKGMKTMFGKRVPNCVKRKKK